LNERHLLPPEHRLYLVTRTEISTAYVETSSLDAARDLAESGELDGLFGELDTEYVVTEE